MWEARCRAPATCHISVLSCLCFQFKKACSLLSLIHWLFNVLKIWKRSHFVRLIVWNQLVKQMRTSQKGSFRFGADSWGCNDSGRGQVIEWGGDDNCLSQREASFKRLKKKKNSLCPKNKDETVLKQSEDITVLAVKMNVKSIFCITRFLLSKMKWRQRCEQNEHPGWPCTNCDQGAFTDYS